MERLILFSQPTEQNSLELTKALFPVELKGGEFAYMPSDGRNTKQVYTDHWRSIAEEKGFRFVFIDNMQEGEDALTEAEKVLSADILLISGGNTFELLDNLRKSGLDNTILEFRKKQQHVLSGFSAGAIVLTPRIDVASEAGGDENVVGITDLAGLGLIDFEVFPHYNELTDTTILEEYRQKSPYKVKALTDDELLVIDK